MSFENLQFLRIGELIVGPKVQGTNAPLEPVDARVFKTRIIFKINLDNSGNANKAKFDIYNLSPESKSFLEKENLVCFFKLGYEFTGLETLFFGDIDQKNGIHSKRNGADIITTIEAGDAEKTLRESFINIGLAEGATNIQLINEIAKAMNVSIEFTADVRIYTYNNGFSYSGQAKKLLDDLGKQSEFEWSIQNGSMIITNAGQTDLQEAVLVNKDTGLLGFPIKTNKKVEFTNLANAKLRPGRAARVESESFGINNGVNIKISKADFDGDTQGGKFQVKVEGEII